MQQVRDVIEKVACTTATVLIRGESGVGKELVARAIHAAGTPNGPFVKVNCAALPGELLESELFGHERGAFTGAYQRKLGKFELARGGTIFLDEIGELSPSLQAKLLHVLQDLRFVRLGGQDAIHVACRVIAATNRDLEAALDTGDFRDDLYYRLNVVEIRVPPLRERKDEIPVLVSTILTRLNEEYGRDAQLPPAQIAGLVDHSWPGNVRELENLLRRLVVLGSAQSVEETLAALKRGRGHAPVQRSGEPSARAADAPTPLGLTEIARRAAQEAERQALAEVLDRVRWNRAEAARLLKVSYKTLLNKITEYGLGGTRSRGPGPS